MKILYNFFYEFLVWVCLVLTSIAKYVGDFVTIVGAKKESRYKTWLEVLTALQFLTDSNEIPANS